MTATATTVSTRGSIGRILALGAGALMTFVLGAALALAATGWFAEGGRSAPAFDPGAALPSHVLREYGPQNECHQGASAEREDPADRTPCRNSCGCCLHGRYPFPALGGLPAGLGAGVAELFSVKEFGAGAPIRVEGDYRGRSRPEDEGWTEPW